MQYSTALPYADTLPVCPTSQEIADFLATEIGRREHRLQHHLDSCADCHEVVAVLAQGSLLAVDSGAGNSSSLVAAAHDQYELGTEIARGGMGRIVHAHDRRLGRDIAIKELLSPSPALERRFEREMKITARLQHPAIISVHDAGRWPSGEQFYTMKYIKGRPFDVVIQQTTTLPQRLALLSNVIAVADALAYAHDQQVLHRDLKPANVLIGDYGETVVIDWGLAKDLRSAEAQEEFVAKDELAGDNALTMIGEAMGTPAYMSPKQARGEPVDQQADVYALGGMLYHLLAGHMPYTDRIQNREELLVLVKSGAPTRLSELAPDVPSDLLAIVDKAMARATSERYAKAADLAADLRRFQNGQRVGVHQYTSRQLVGRWVRRHLAAVSVATAAIVLLAAGGVRLVREQRQAEVERKLADESRASVEDLMSFMIVDLGESLEPLGKLELLSLVAEKAHAYYSKQPIDWSEKERVTERFKVLLSLGSILSAQGDPADAAKAYLDALAIAIRNAQEIDSLDWRLSVAKAHRNLGGSYSAQGEPALAIEQLQAAMRVFSVLSSTYPSEEPKWDSQRASVLNELGTLFRDTGKPEQALELLEDSIASNRRRAQRFPEDPNHQRSLADSIEQLGTILTVHGTSESALTNYTQALKIREKLADDSPDDFGLQRQLSVTNMLIGDAMRRSGRGDDALEMFLSSQVISQRLFAHDPQNALWTQDLADSHLRVGDMYRLRKEHSEAIEHFSRALEISKELTLAHPKQVNSKKTVASIYGVIGELYRETKHPKKSLAAYLESKDITESLIAQTPKDTSLKRNLALIFGMLGALYDSLRDVHTARQYYEECADLYEKYGTSASDFYNGASCVALINNTGHAFKLLERAIDAGFNQRDWLMQDESFRSLKKDPRWAGLLARLPDTNEHEGRGK